MENEKNAGNQGTPPTIDDILRGSSHALTIFKPRAAEKLEIYLGNLSAP